METLRLKPREKKINADAKRKEAEADRQADLKGVKVMRTGLGERSSRKSPVPMMETVGSRNKLKQL